MLSSNYIAATHNITYSPCTSTCTTHPALPFPLPSTTLLGTQLTNTKHSWQNGTKCRDGVNVLWYHSHPVWLVFEGSIPTSACFHSENFFVTLVFCVCTLTNTINDREACREDARYRAFTRLFAQRGRIFGNLQYMNVSVTVYNECICRKKRSIHQLDIRTGTAQNCSESFIAMRL